jgi:hypothetical protein
MKKTNEVSEAEKRIVVIFQHQPNMFPQPSLIDSFRGEGEKDGRKKEKLY